ncbi:MAG TPA: hypothetical protein VIT93_04530 [Dehalococcoidia bacterium]
MLGLIFFGAPLAYAALNVYLFAQILPVPITILPEKANDYSRTPEPVPG